MRIHGDMTKLNYREVTAETAESLIFEILTDKQKERFKEHWDLDLSYPLQGIGPLSRQRLYAAPWHVGGLSAHPGRD
jgi:Tfp pilus assembly pilus retraction ATPase PilT